MNTPGDVYPWKDRAARTVYRNLPRGMQLDPAVLKEFFDPPSDVGQWFLTDAWVVMSAALEADDGVTGPQYTEILGYLDIARSGMLSWTQARDPATAGQGWGATSSEMRADGHGAYYGGIRPLVKSTAILNEAEANTLTVAKDFCDVMWEYAACMAIEMEASTSQLPADGIMESANRGQTHPWKPAMTPENIGRPDLWTGTHRLPPAPDPPGFWDPPEEPEDPWDPGSEGGEGGGDAH